MKMRRAKEMKGLRFIHILSSCPPGWKFPSELSVKIARLAVETKIFPLYEIEGGTRFTLNVKPRGLPVSEYLKLQGRFSHLNPKAIQDIQVRVEEEWARLVSRMETRRRRTSAVQKKGQGTKSSL